MRNWLRSPTLLKIFVGQHILNGLSVAVAVMAVAVAASALFGFAAGQPATLGAISASISDFPAPWRVKARTMLVGFGLALASTSTIQLVGASAPAEIVAIGVIAFCAGMVTGFGRWALSLERATAHSHGLRPGPAARRPRDGAPQRGDLRGRRPRLYRPRADCDAAERRQRPALDGERVLSRIGGLSESHRALHRSGDRCDGGLRRGDPPAGRFGRSTASGARLASGAAARHARTRAARRDDRHSARRLRRAGRGPMRSSAIARRGRGADPVGAHRRRRTRRRARSAASQPRIADQRQAASAARPCPGDRRHAPRGCASGRGRRGEPGRARRDRNDDAASARRPRPHPPPRARLVRRRRGGSGDRANRSFRLRAAPLLRPAPAGGAAHAGFAGVSLRRAARRGDDGRARSSRSRSAARATAIGCC